MKSLVINREDLKHNIRIIKEIAKDTGRLDNHKNIEIIGVVKGNGYGLGLIPYSRFLIDNGIDFLAVATVEEAIQLRESKVQARILMLSSTAVEKDVEKLIQNDIILTIGSKESVEVVDKIGEKLNRKVKVHLKIDTGFGRYGFCYDEKKQILDAINKANNLEIEGIFSHFTLAFFHNNKFSETQFKRFIDVVEYLKENKINTGMLHICNSSGFLKFKDKRLNAVRIGSAFLGRLSIPNIYGLKRVGYLKSQVAEIKNMKKGYNIGYSNAYTLKKDSKVAIIPIGYADGFNVRDDRDMFRKIDRIRYIVRDVKDSFKDKSLYVSIMNKQGEFEKCKVIGRLGMYHVSVDITGKDILIGANVKFNVNPIFVDSNIRREYISGE